MGVTFIPGDRSYQARIVWLAENYGHLLPRGQGWRVPAGVEHAARNAVRADWRMATIGPKHGKGKRVMNLCFLIGPDGTETPILQSWYARRRPGGPVGYFEIPHLCR